MVHMNISKGEFNFFGSNTFKNMIIVFGMCLSLFTITSFDFISGTREIVDNSDNPEMTEVISVEKQALQGDKSSSPNEQKVKTHYNFIASYLLQESSVKRETKKTSNEQNIVSHLLQLHKIIISKTIGSF